MTVDRCCPLHWRVRRDYEAARLVDEAYARWSPDRTLVNTELLRDAAANLVHHLTAERTP